MVERHRKTLAKVIQGRSDASVRFDDLCALLRQLGFDERTKGSHHLFRREGIPDRVNLQRQGSDAKPYQVRQVRRILLENGLASPEE